jgi:hypothetical protein
MLGDWDAAQAELTQTADAQGMADIDYLACYWGWIAALRGDTGTAATMLAGLRNLPASEDPQDQAAISVAEAFTAAARGHPRDALRLARATLAHAGAMGISHEFLCWAWPLAARAAFALRDSAAARDLLAQLDAYQPGHLAPMLRAEGHLVRARLAVGGRDPAATTLFAAAISCLRENGTPTTWPTACSTTPGTSCACTTPKPPGLPSARSATSPVTCAASHCWTGLRTSRRCNPRCSIRSRRFPV